MKNVLFLLLMAYSQSTFSQSLNSIFPELPYSDLEHIAVKGNNIFTAGDCGVALISTNDGEDWTTIEFDESARALELVPGSNGEKALYLTSRQIFELDINTQIFTPRGDDLLPISGNLSHLEVNDNKIFVVATGGVFEASPQDYLWTKLGEPVYTGENEYTSGVSLSENYIYLGSRKGEIVKLGLADGSTTNYQSFSHQIYDLEMVSDDLGYAYVAAQNSFSKTTDGGQTWSMLTGIPEGINPTSFGSDVIMSINTNRIYVSLDGGNTSTHYPFLEDIHIDLVSAAYMTEEGDLYLSGRSSMVLKSTNFAESFENLNKYKRSDLQSLDINTNGIGYAAGYSGSVIKTSDGGDTWSPQEIGLTVNDHPTSVVSYPDGRLVIGHDQGVAIFNNDILEEYQTDRRIDFLINSNSGDYLIGVMRAQSEGKIVKSTDRGKTWTDKIFVPQSYVLPYQSPTGKLYVPSGDSRVYTSVDDGENWTIEEYAYPEISTFSYINDNQGIFLSEGSLYKTEDGGQSGTLIAEGNAIRNLHYFDQDHILFTKTQSGGSVVQVSTNGGTSFATVMEFCNLTNASFYDGDKTIWLVQKGGHINKYVFEELDGTSSLDPFIIEELTMSPNPISSGQLLDLGMGIKNNLQVQIYDITGMQVGTFQVADHSIVIPDLRAGYYLIDIQEEGTRYTGKIILIE